MTARSLGEAIQESHAALGAISNGDVEPYMVLYSDGDDITVGNPFGPFVRGKGGGPRGGRADRVARPGRPDCGVRTGGDARGRRIGVLAEVARFRAKVGGSNSPASIGLQVTSVYRREDGIWRLCTGMSIRSRRLRPRSR
jgi:hypothetical protein